MLGIFSVQEAQKLADSKNLDLLKIVPNAKPPVCKITDYSKSLFEQAKREKQAKKNQKVVSLKEVRLSAQGQEVLAKFTEAERLKSNPSLREDL